MSYHPSPTSGRRASGGRRLRSIVHRWGGGRLAALVAVGLGLALPRPGATQQVASPADPPERRVEERIARVQAGLPPGVRIVNRPDSTFSLVERMERHRVPAVSVAVVEDGRIEWARAWGVADLASGARADAGTLFQAASMSKPVAAVAALQLVDDGSLDLDEDVNEKLTSWKVPANEEFSDEPVTLRRLLTHSAGLTVHGFRGYAPGEPIPTTTQVLDGAGPANSAPVRIEIEPGSTSRYSGGGYTVVQQLVADLRGHPFAVVMQQRVLDPLGMKLSTYAQPLPAKRRERAATGYRSNQAPVSGGWHVYPEMAAAGMWTTATDLARYLVAVQRIYAGEEGGVLTPATVREMLSPGIGSMGLGPAVMGRDETLRFSHGGANEGFRGRFVAYAELGKGAVVMTNSDSGNPLVEELLLAIAAEYQWPGMERQTIRETPLSADQAAEYAGRYRLPGSGSPRIEVEREGTRLFLTVGTEPRTEIVHVGRGGFVIRGSGADLRFERDEGGGVVAIRAYGLRAGRAPDG